ncbi:hypothetical protein F7018_16335 [Tenacibaculum aiptasiae]|uniref:Glycerophosphoryl diester phosphodiesterase membrane domain-containing protein n=1 Tax=Tenacibaculum aiptasiae TaxID=426481 RepID=A0A7J5A7Y9_9FLAO|nr:hypothetical protein [Tenacibaculum aiptasiae]KAB1153635.1 hypothetical protein F7018_16335 [Tenacibaculum aiptasiae]
MTKEYIEFKKERDLGSIITDAFKFIRLEGKPFFKTIMKVSIIPILLAIASLIFYMYSASSMFSGLDLETHSNPTPNLGFAGGMFLSAILMSIFYLIALVYVNLAGMYYIKSYIDNEGVVKEDYIKEEIKSKFWSFTGMLFLMGIIFVVSAMLCFFPIFYTIPVLSLTASIFVYENVSATDAVGKSFNFINGHFWETLGVVIVVGLLVMVLGYIFQIPAAIYQLIQVGIGIRDQDPTQIFNIFMDPIFLILTIVAYIGRFFFYSITLITNVFIYFDINEQKNLTGTIEKIDGLGQ